LEQALNTTIRLLVVVALVAAINVGAWFSRLSPGNVVPPARDVRAIPLQFPQWKGENIEMADYQYQALGAAKDSEGELMVVNRNYRNLHNEQVTFHADVFFDYGVGMFHEPKNCFRSQGYHLVGDEKPVQLEVPGGSIEARVGVWEHNGEYSQVLYWYQLGEYVIHNRSELGSARWALRGKTEWPSLVKFLLVTSGNTPEAEARVKNIAEEAIAWFQSDVSPPEAAK
jgi:EpsI family protein